MIPQALLAPSISRALILASPTLVRSAALSAPVLVGVSQSRTCFSWFRRRHHARLREHEQAARFLAQERYLSVSDARGREPRHREIETEYLKWLRDVQRGRRDLGEEIRQRQKEFMASRSNAYFKLVPQDVRRQVEKDMLELEVYLSKMWGKKNVVPRLDWPGLPRWWYEKRMGSADGLRTWFTFADDKGIQIKAEVEAETKPAERTTTKPLTTTESSSATAQELEYDPISNRMKAKPYSQPRNGSEEEVVSHYRQELDTATHIPIKPAPKQKPSAEDIVQKNPSVSDVQAELTKDKAQPKDEPLTDTRIEFFFKETPGQPPAARGTLSYGDRIFTVPAFTEPERARLEKSFVNIHKELAASWEQIGNPRWWNSLGNLRKEIRTLQREFIAKDKEIGGAEKLEKAAAAEKRPAAPQKTAVPDAIRDSTAVLTELSEQVHDMSKWLQTLHLPKERTSKTGNVFPLIFGEKDMPKQTEGLTQKTDEVLEREVAEQKRAMSKAEEAARVSRDVRTTDAQLLREMERIYETEYGKINSRHRQVPALPPSPPPSPPPQAAFTESVDSTSQVQPPPPTRQPKDTQQPLAPTSSTGEQSNAVYTVLAYDPSTNEVSTTTLSAPVGADEAGMPLTVALTHLSEPAKFLPHLRLMPGKDRVQAVSVTKNLLVLRGLATPSSAASSKGVGPAGKGSKESFPRLAEQAKTVNAKAESVNVDTSPEAGRPVRRLEQVYSGKGRSQEEESWEESEVRDGKREGRRQVGREFVSFTIKLSMVTAAAVYLLGLKDGMSKVEAPKPMPDILVGPPAGPGPMNVSPSVGGLWRK